MNFLAKVYRKINYLSLDVASGAMACAVFFARIMEVQLRPYGVVSLGVTVWIIYTVDHLLDARRIKREASSPRHRFHQENFKTLQFVVLTAMVLDLVLIAFVRRPILNWGLVLAIAVGVYLFFQRRLLLFKEVTISLLYSAGVLLPALSLRSMPLSLDLITLIILFVLTTYINLIIFSWYDWNQDISDNHSSFVTYFGKAQTSRILSVLFIVQGLIFTGSILNSSYQKEILVLGLMNLVLLMVYLFPQKLANQDLYRMIGDSVFLFPFLYNLS